MRADIPAAPAAAADAELQAWVGRFETREGTIDPGAVARLDATLDRAPAGRRAGEPAPPLAHWLAFLPEDRQSALGEDGHARRTEGGLLPPIPDLPRRMWAGGRLRFPGALPMGEPLTRRSEVVSAARKAGRSGDLAFVSVRHEVSRPAGPPLLIEEHDILYRGGAGAGAARPAAEAEAEAPAHRARTLTPDAVLLFRFSALTFNGHRIHYDRDYAAGVEGYPGLVVHGPLTALLLLDLAQEAAGRRPPLRLQLPRRRPGLRGRAAAPRRRRPGRWRRGRAPGLRPARPGDARRGDLRGGGRVSRPLDGVLVVSLEQAVAAPYATRLLADQGARVVKVERAGRGRLRPRL